MRPSPSWTSARRCGRGSRGGRQPAAAGRRAAPAPRRPSFGAPWSSLMRRAAVPPTPHRRQRQAPTFSPRGERLLFLSLHRLPWARRGQPRTRYHASQATRTPARPNARWHTAGMNPTSGAGAASTSTSSWNSRRATAGGGEAAGGALAAASAAHCPGQKPPFLAVKRPARPYKTAIQKQFTAENAKGA
jgi:hypothetical protein